MSINNSTRVAFIATEGTEQVEFDHPWAAVRDAGAQAMLLSPDGGDVQFFNHTDKGDTKAADLAVPEADPSSFAALVLPGGVVGADFLRVDEYVVDFVRRFAATEKPLAVICHAPWILIEAGQVHGRTLTSFPSLKTDLKNAGATWVDVPVHTDGALITSRTPDDLQAFSATLVAHLSVS